MSGKTRYTIQEAIKKLAGTGSKWLIEGLVISVGEASCKVRVDDGIEFEDVLLKAPGDGADVQFTPEVGSVVVLGVTSDSILYVLAVSTVSSVRLGGGKYGALKAEDLIEQLNKTNAAVQKILDTLGGVLTYAPNDGGASMHGQIKNKLLGVNTGDFEGLINDKLRHGN